MKRISFIFCIILFGCLVSSCATTFVWDDTIPKEQTAQVVFWYFGPNEYNGINVNPKDFRIVVLPSGSATFTGRVFWNSGRGGAVTYYFNVDEATFSCNLEAGANYTARVAYRYNEEIKKSVWGIDLMDWNEPKATRRSEFIPFDPPVLSN